LKASSLTLPSAAALLAAVLLAAATVAQVPQAATPLPRRVHPAPTNLKVLPKDLTGQQVREIMEQWADSLGVRCDNCHAADPNNIGPNGRPRLNFADDSKPEKATARLMFTMTEEINRNYIAKIENSGAPVTCGTCHRGHFGPEPFVIPREDGPRPPQGSHPAETKPPQPK
jgi:cytochrome c553